MTKLKPKAFILLGPPCSGKTTWRNNYLKKNYARVISRDDIRRDYFDQPYKYNTDNEAKVTEIENQTLSYCVIRNKDIIIDATHCKKAYLLKALKRFEDTDYFVTVVVHHVSFQKQRWRNFWRWIKTGIWIPRKISISMWDNYKALIPELYYPELYLDSPLLKNYITYFNGKILRSIKTESEHYE